MPRLSVGQRINSAIGRVKVVMAKPDGAIVLDETRYVKRFLTTEELFPGQTENPRSEPDSSPVGQGLQPPGDRSSAELMTTAAPPRPPPKAAQDIEAVVRTRPPSEARRTLEALRFGLVPWDGLKHLTLGYEALESWVRKRLPDAHGHSAQLSEIRGPFGTGKSHTCAVIRQVAREEGYVTARVEVDGASISLADPQGLLYGFWSSMQGKDLNSATSLLDLYIRTIENGHRAPRVAPRGIDRIQRNYEAVRLLIRRNLLDVHGPMLDGLLSSSSEYTAIQVTRAITSEPGIYHGELDLKPMVGRSVADRPFDFLEALIGHAVIAQLAGYQGLILTIDEFEVEVSNLTRHKWSRAVALLDLLSKYLCGKTDHINAPLGIFIASVGEGEHTGDVILERLVREVGGDTYRLTALSKEDRATLARRIHSVYEDAYGQIPQYASLMTDAVERDLEHTLTDSGLTRAFIKRFMAELDAAYGPPAAAA